MRRISCCYNISTKVVMKDMKLEKMAYSAPSAHARSWVIRADRLRGEEVRQVKHRSPMHCDLANFSLFY